MLILIVEDDLTVAETYVDALESEGYDCEQVADGDRAAETLSTRTYDLVLLDIELPHRSGLELLQEIRERSPQQPVLLVTGRGEIPDRVKGLDLGADDYLVKPIPLPELLARVRTVLRRVHGGDALNLAVDDLRVDVANHRVTYAGEEVDLTNKEFELLVRLVRQLNRTVTYEELARDIWKRSEKANPINNLVASHVSHLREKLETRGCPQLIHTVWGQGFCLRAPDDEPGR